MDRKGRWATHLDGHPGLPDLILARKGRLIFLEVKAERGKLSPEQQLWLDELESEDWIAQCVRPTDFEEIVRLLE